MNVSPADALRNSIQMMNDLNRTIVDNSQDVQNKLVKAVVQEQVKGQETESKAKSVDLLA